MTCILLDNLGVNLSFYTNPACFFNKCQIIFPHFTNSFLSRIIFGWNTLPDYVMASPLIEVFTGAIAVHM